MYVRVVRFTDVDPDKLDALLARIEAAEGPPPGVDSAGIDFLHDRGQRTVVVVQRYASEQDMETAAKVLDAMDGSETPGTRGSVDACELRLSLDG